jgi:hypothetical protein
LPATSEYGAPATAVSPLMATSKPNSSRRAPLLAVSLLVSIICAACISIYAGRPLLVAGINKQPSEITVKQIVRIFWVSCSLDLVPF